MNKRSRLFWCLCWTAAFFCAADSALAQRRATQPRPASSTRNATTQPQAAGPERPTAAREAAPRATPKVARRGVQQRGTQQRSTSVPLGFPLEVERQQRVDQILRFWEVETAKITTFKADYERREYDPVMGPVGKPNAIVRGHVRYYAPDRGLMQDKQIYNFDPGAGQGDKPFKLAEDQHGEDWVCTGTSIFLKQPENKLLIERQLPPDLQGKAISEGPLPFLFGAKAETMKRRFWIREVTPKDNPNGDYFLEAIPKNREDAANYERVVVVLDKKDHFLPKKMEVTIRTLQAKGGAGKPGKTLRRVDVYVFKDRKVNDPTDRVKGFFATFVRPTLPKGWKTQVLDWNMQPVNGPIAEQPASSRQAQTRPKTDPRRAR